MVKLFGTGRDTGETQVWSLDGTRIRGRNNVVDENGNPTRIGPPWSIAGVSDVDGNGNSDLIWYNGDTGETQIWSLDGTRIRGRNNVVDENGNPTASDRPGASPASATSTATETPTSSGTTATPARPRSGPWTARGSAAVTTWSTRTATHPHRTALEHRRRQRRRRQRKLRPHLVQQRHRRDPDLVPGRHADTAAYRGRRERQAHPASDHPGASPASATSTATETPTSSGTTATPARPRSGPWTARGSAAVTTWSTRTATPPASDHPGASPVREVRSLGHGSCCCDAGRPLSRPGRSAVLVLRAQWTVESRPGGEAPGTGNIAAGHPGIAGQGSPTSRSQ